MSERNSADAARRLSAKRQNERVKLLVSFLNTLSLAVIGAAFVIPGIASFEAVRWIWLPVALVLHVGAQAALSLLTSED